VLQALRDTVNEDLRLYPDPEGKALRRTIAQMHGLDMANVFIGNGSDEVLALAFRGLLKHAQPVLFPDVSYSFYPVYCALFGIAYEPVAVNAAYEVDVADYARPNGGIVIPNPNAPTGIALGLQQIRALLQASPDSVVVVDEAYVDFGAESAVPLVKEFPNLLVVQTLSKSHSLAGLRVGYAIGDVGLIQAMTVVKDSFNSYPLDRLALAGADAALRDVEHFESTRRKIIASRESLTQALTELGFEVLPSQANFVFARHPKHDGKVLAQQLRDRKVLVRHFDKPRIADFLRITIGTPEQCDVLVDALRDVLTR
jgi:histidinol-phosphate aminotransferase